MVMSLKQIIIPARAGSKGWPGKNRRLFNHTIDIIPSDYKKYVLVSTDDVEIANKCDRLKIGCELRDPKLAADKTDIKSVLTNIGKRYKYKPTDLIVMLYLTYPDREWSHVEDMYLTFASNGYQSMLCRQPVLSHPCLTMIETGTDTGTPVMNHDMYQRQQYPECFELSHYVTMYRQQELKHLNKNLYNQDTRYYSIDRCVDVDHEQDYINKIIMKKA